MEVERKASLEQNAREKMIAAEWGEQLPLCYDYYLVLGNHWLILAIRCEGEVAGRICPSMCQALWTSQHPLCTVIKETGRTFFTHARDMRSNLVNSRGVRPLGPQGIKSCHCQAILAEDGVTARRNQASSLTSLPAEQSPFDPGDKCNFGLSYFRGMYFRNLNFIGVGFSLRSFALFVLFEHKYRLSSGLALYSRL
jgi:hypothetical protein